MNTLTVKTNYALSGDVKTSISSTPMSHELQAQFHKELSALMTKYQVVKIDMCFDVFAPVIPTATVTQS